jgi:hypothetical protein
VILCADDYGISPGVSKAILRLVDCGRVSAVSCMMTEPEIQEDLKHLDAHNEHIDIGLHLVLTESAPLSSLSPASGLVDASNRMPGLGTLVRRAYCGSLDAAGLEREIRTQIDRFSELTGRFPAFVDGHQHVQQLAGIREALGTVLEEADNTTTFYCRCAGLPPGALLQSVFCLSPRAALRNAVIAAPAASTRSVYHTHRIRHNRYLLGVYDVEEEMGFADVFSFYLSLEPAPEDIFLCHPGKVDDVLRRRDPLLEAREDVLSILESEQTIDIMERYGVALNTFC